MSIDAVTVNVLAEPAGTDGHGQNPAPVNVATADAGPPGANGISFSNNGRTWLRVVNKNAAAASIRFWTAQTVKGLAVDDVVPGNANVVGSGTNDGVTEFGPFDPSLFGGTVTVTWTSGGGAGGLDFAAFTLG